MTRESKTTRDKLFDAACQEFSERGYAGAVTQRIADRAGVNRERLYHYFGDKRRLFLEVLGQRLADLAQAVPIDPGDLAEYAGRVFDFHAANPDLVRLLHWEGLELDPSEVSGQLDRQAFYARKLQAVRVAQKGAAPDHALDAGRLMFTIIAVTASWFAVPQLAGLLVPGQPYSPENLAAHRRHVVDVVRRLLAEQTSR